MQVELIEKIIHLPIAEQREIIEKVRRHIEQASASETSDEFRRELSVEERIAIAINLSGSLKPETRYVPMTREEEREIIEEYLAEKYA